MKLKPPTPNISGEDPYKEDLFSRKDFGDSLTSLFGNIKDNIVLCINAPWGEGKTTFANMWKKELDSKGIKCIYYDAYEHDYCEDPFISFCAEIISMIEKEFAGKINVIKESNRFKEKAKEVGTTLFMSGTKIAMKIFSAGCLEYDDFRSIGDCLAGNTKKQKPILDMLFEKYHSYKNTVSEFKRKLSNLGKVVREEQHFPLIFIIDELDRCRPDFALSLIERIKHFFYLDNINFILLVNMEQLENYVRTIYGNDVEANLYLQKFITHIADLPKEVTPGDKIDDITGYFEKLISHHGLSGHRRSLQSTLLPLMQNYNLSLREIEQVFTLLSLYYSQSPFKLVSDETLVMLLVIIRKKKPEIYKLLAENRITANEFKEKIMDQLDDECNESMNYIQFLLLDSKEYSELDQNIKEKIYRRLPISRTKMIPFHCQQISRIKMFGGIKEKKSPNS